MTPSLTGWIDKAKENALITPCRACVTAAQTLASEAYGKAAAGSAIYVSDGAIAKLAGLSDVGTVSGVEIDGATAVVNTLIYTEKATNKNVTYRRLLEPHFVFGEGVGKRSSAAQSTMEKMGEVLLKMEEEDVAFLQSYKVINGYNAKNEGTKANTIYNSLDAEQKAFLDERTWTIIRTGLDLDGNGSLNDLGYRIYFTNVNYGKDGSASGIRVYKYGLKGYDNGEPVMGKLQYSDKGSVAKGQITQASVTVDDWSGWLDPSDPQLGL